MTRPTYLEFDLRFLISRCGVANGVGIRRLNGIENTLAALASRWRVPAPILPAEELRMSKATRQHMIDWVTTAAAMSEDLEVRLAPYASGMVCDERIPLGWIRLCLREPEIVPDGGG